MLLNRNIFSQIIGLNFNVHSQKHFFRAAQEGIAFAIKYGLDIMEEAGIQPEVIRAGNANMFFRFLCLPKLVNFPDVSVWFSCKHYRCC